MSREDWVSDVLESAAEALQQSRPILSANVHAIRDELVEGARLSDGCLHYDYPASRKMRGELVCGGCSIIFGYWREPPIQVTVRRE